ncbi:predicted protein [Nematostella vectensis]|uniref:RRP12-like protein n=1 Tax=Nematostella vectensis TaxID=45351 RepID=A7RIM7_NEMVE|nr:predicted protein [Nematostella vectensis]|eukprot:XP_001640806.1 predicted protein [Nematostella vectensis]
MVRLRKGKGQKWRKGQSCVSNPQTRTHRSNTKRGVITGQKSNTRSNLTMEALARHDEVHESDVELGSDEEKSLKSAGMFSISGLTDCTNPAFESIRRFANTQLASQKEVCAVLAAVTEVIKSQGGSETETEYFAALMTALESAQDQESMTAIAYLLTLIIKRVPESILKTKFSKASQVILSSLAAYAGDGGSSLLKSLLGCLCQLLVIQERAVWSESSTVKIYHGLLSFTIHSKPKVRKSAHEAVHLLLRSPPAGTEFHPAAAVTAKFAIQQIQQHGGSSQAVTTLHIIGLLKEILPCLPVQNVKSVCENLLKLMTLGNVMVTVNSLQTLFKMFEASPSAASLSPELNAQIINALYDYQPSANDIDLSQAWITTMEKAHSNLTRLDSKLCVANLARCFSSLMSYFLSDHKVLAHATAATLKELLHNCLSSALDELMKDLKKPNAGTNTSIHKIIRCLEAGLKYRYQASWGLILQVLNSLFEVAGEAFPNLMSKVLVSLCDLRGTYQFPHIRELDRAVGMAIQKMGPKNVLTAVPLGLGKETDDCNFPRSWLLPILKDNIKDTQLKYFFDEMLPLAADLRAKAVTFTQAGKDLESKVFDTLQLQIWSLLPGFCTRPTDVVQSFKSVARILGVALTERSDLRLIVCQALRILVSKSEKAEEKKELAAYAKNYLPILFNLYSADPKNGDPDKLPVLETVRTYLTITDPKLTSRFFTKAIEKVNSKETISWNSRNCMMDLVIAMVPYVNESNLQTLYNMVVPSLKSQDVTQQKKAYRVLEQMCSSDSQACRAFLSSHLDQLQDKLLNSLASSSSASKAPRLRCLTHIVKHLGAEHKDFITAIIPEVILCTKEVGTKARAAALSLLVANCHALCRCVPGTRAEGLVAYLELVLAGLAGSPHMVSATIISISRLVFEFRGDIPSKVMEQLIESVLVCLKSKTKEVIKSALGFLKVVISVMSREDLAPYARDLASGIVTWNEDNRRRFRYNVKVLFERLIRKFGYQTALKCVPEDHQKLVHNIHKTTQRLKRQKIISRAKNMGADVDDQDTLAPHMESYEALMFGSDDEDDNEAGPKKNAKVQGKGPKTWIREGAEEEPVDFMDANVVQRVVATDPRKGKRKLVNDFETSSDGKLIIPADEEDEDDPKPKRKKSDGIYA